MSSKSPLIAASVIALSLALGAGSALAECKTMGFIVNDYGKDGPTKDAKELLDKDIAKWAADNGVEKYTVGKKTVKCELFLDVILFDEHTCTASASVCWGAGVTPPAKTAKEGSTPNKEGSTPKKKSEAKAGEGEAKAPVETGAISPEAPAKSDAAAKTETPPVAVEQPPAATPPPAPKESDAAERAAAAAERAAAAAERAAAAAEKAAAGNKSASATEPSDTAARQIAPASGAAKP